LKPLDSLLIAAGVAPQGPARYRLYEQALEGDPDDAYARLLYGAELMHRGPLAGLPLDSATVVLGESSAKDPSLTPPQDQRVWALIFLGRRDEARAALDRMQRTPRPDPGPDIDTRAALQVAFVARFEPARLPELLKNTPQGVQQDIGRILRLSLGFDSPEAERLLGQRAAGRPERSARATGHEAEGLALFATGRPDSALAHFDSAAALFGTATATLEALEWRLVPAALGVSEPAAADAARARTQLAAIAVANGSTAARAAWALAVDAYARGDTADARSWRSRVRGRARGDDAVGRLDTLLAALELGARSRFAAALARSAALLPFDESELLGDPFARTVLHAHRAEWLERLRDPAAADRDWLWYENSDFEGWLTGEVEAVEIDWAFDTWARWRRARNALASGDTTRACHFLARAVELWQHADGSAPDVADARALREKCPR
jgi:tetratricopeptide (TPR) repeat protein